MNKKIIIRRESPPTNKKKLYSSGIAPDKQK